MTCNQLGGVRWCFPSFKGAGAGYGSKLKICSSATQIKAPLCLGGFGCSTGRAYGAGTCTACAGFFDLAPAMLFAKNATLDKTSADILRVCYRSCRDAVPFTHNTLGGVPQELSIQLRAIIFIVLILVKKVHLACLVLMAISNAESFVHNMPNVIPQEPSIRQGAQYLNHKKYTQHRLR